MSVSMSDRTVRLLAGPELLGYFFNWSLLGVLNVQVYLYHVTFPRDPIFLQCLVYGVLIFEWIQTGLLTAGSFEIFVYQYGDFEALTKIYNGWFCLPVMCAMVSMVVQWFFAWRIYLLSKIRVLVGVIVTLSLLQGICGIVTGVQLKNLASTADVFSDSSVLTVIIIWLAGGSLVDITIAVTMTILMVKRKTGIRKTDMVVNKIIRLVVETGTLTASFAIFAIILALAFPGTLYYEPAIHSLAKLYSNTFVTNLLNRAFLNGVHHPNGSSTLGHISLTLTPAAPDAEGAQESGSVSGELGGDRSVVYPIQKLGGFVLDKPSV